MQSTTGNTSAPQPLERFLAILGAVACLVITIVIWRSVSAHQGMWPLPGLYFIEIAGVSIASMLAFVRGDPSGRIIMWAAIGILGAFSIVGALSVGFFFLPIGMIFAIASLSYDVRRRQPLAAHLGVCLIAGMAQAALMFVVIGLL